MLLKELTLVSNKLDSIKASTQKTSKMISSDEEEYQRFMSSLLEDCVEKIQKKIDKEKQTNQKLRFIS
jgi:hypothetical protein